MRREVISSRLTQKQRLLLETHMKAEKDRQTKNFRQGRELPMLRDGAAANQVEKLSSQATSRGIHKSASRGHVYGYYASAGIHNLMLCTRIQRDLAATVQDHIVLLRIVEQIRTAYDGIGKNFSEDVRRIVATILQEEHLSETEFLRAVRVSFSAQHWIGRNLFVHRDRLDSALRAWDCFNDIKGPQLFKGSQLSMAYTPERAREQWMRARAVFIDLQLETCRNDPSRVEQQLAAWEAQCRGRIARAALLWQQRRGQPAPKSHKTSDCILRRRIEKVIWSWDLAIARECRKKMRANMRERKQQWRTNKRCRWDGKEPLEQFERRMRSRQVQ